jgi:hypothetical protein
VQRYRRIDELPSCIPMFPLDRCILLPRASLPLQIFEPRYLAMVDDVLRTDRVIGIVQPACEGGETGSPQDNAAPLRTIGCVGRLTAFQELANGRLLVSLTGIARFQLGREEPGPEGYRRFNVDYRLFANDFQAGLGEETVDRDVLIDALRRYLSARELEGDWDAIARSSTEQLVNSLSVASPFGSEEKQALLEAIDLKSRAQTLVALAEMDLAGGSTAGGTLLQ